MIELTIGQALLFWGCCWYVSGLLAFGFAMIMDWYRGISITIKDIIEYLFFSLLGLIVWLIFLKLFLDNKTLCNKVVIKGRGSKS